MARVNIAKTWMKAVKKQPIDTNIGATVAAAWEEAIKNLNLHPDLSVFDAIMEDRRKWTPQDEAKFKATMKKAGAEFKRKSKRMLDKCKGRIVRAEGDLYNLTLIYADGRRLAVNDADWVKKPCRKRAAHSSKA